MRGRPQKPPIYKPGDIVGDLKVVQCNGRAGTGLRWWIYDCQCMSCGAILEDVREDRIADGSMCWLCKVNQERKKKAEELRGKSFGVWTVTDAMPHVRGQHLIWQARCKECGAVNYFRQSQLESSPRCINCIRIRKGAKK